MQENSYSAGVFTLGCKVNQYESRAIEEEFARRGFRVLPHTEVCDVYVINTCTVTSEADRKARQFIRRAAKKNPEARIIVCGCLSQREPEKIAKIDGVDLVLGNCPKLKAVDEALRLLDLPKHNPSIEVTDINSSPFENMRVESFERTRAYIKIEDGCESKCAYCVIPSVRGKIRSKGRSEILAEAAELSEKGFREIVLTGIEICSWGRDFGQEDLCGLLAELDKLNGIERIRLGSLDPSFMTFERIDILAKLKKLTPHFHLSLQSGCDRTLAAMRRRYNTKMMYERMSYLREKIPDVTFTTDVMTGFPGETDEDFAETCAFMQKAEFLAAHIFTYSRRPGTEADKMPDQVDESIKIKRSAELEAICKEAGNRVKSRFIGRSLPVLFETYENGIAVGHTPNYLQITVRADRDCRGETLPVTLTEINRDGIIGTL